MNDEEDEEDLPSFPWPMWIPAVSWIVHALALFAACIEMIVKTPDSPYAVIDQCIVAFILPFATVFLTVGIMIVRGHAFSLRFAELLSVLLASVFMVLILNSGVPRLTNPYVWYYGMDAIVLFVAAIIALTFHSRFLAWIDARRASAT